MNSLRLAATFPYCMADPVKKAQLTLELDSNLPVDNSATITSPLEVPARPSLPELVPLFEIRKIPLSKIEGRAAMIHSFAHIELNAVDLALDIVWRFPDMPDEFYREWIAVAKEEALHFTLLRNYLVELGFDYGSFKAHNVMWQIADRTKHDILGRIAIIPRTLEARGLDATPISKRRLTDAGDHKIGDILDIILQDEIGHVAIGNKWYNFLCGQRGLDPVKTYEDLLVKYDAPRLKGPFNVEARKQAGFTEIELAELSR